jgi:hypothetical protein
MLLAIGLPLGGIRARLEQALELRGRSGVLIVDVPIALLLGRPTKLKVLAFLIAALPGTRVSLLVLGEITWPLELFLAVTAAVQNVPGLVRLPAASHGSTYTFVVHLILGQAPLGG